MVPKHSLLKYFTLTFTRHKSSKLEGSGPTLKGQASLGSGPQSDLKLNEIELNTQNTKQDKTQHTKTSLQNIELYTQTQNKTKHTTYKDITSKQHSTS